MANTTARLKALGLDATTIAETRLPVSQLVIEDTHPRKGQPLDPKMVASIRKDGVEKNVLVQDMGGGIMRVLDGCRRVEHALAAQEEERQARGDSAFVIKVKLDFFVGTPVEALLARLGANSDPLKKDDTASVLFATYTQLVALGADVADIVDMSPKGVGAREVDALLRFGNLTEAQREQFDSGKAPIGILAAVLDEVVEGRDALLAHLIERGATSSKGATRMANQKKRDEADAKGEKAPAGTAHIGRTRIHPKTLTHVAESLEKHGSSEEQLAEQTEIVVSAQTSPEARHAAANEIREASLCDGFMIGLMFALGNKRALDELPEEQKKTAVATLAKLKKLKKTAEDKKAAREAKKAAKAAAS